MAKYTENQAYSIFKVDKLGLSTADKNEAVKLITARNKTITDNSAMIMPKDTRLNYKHSLWTLTRWCYSDGHSKYNKVNYPTEKNLSNITRLASFIDSALKNKPYYKNLYLSSGLRRDPLNQAVNGVYLSDHLYGCAADLQVCYEAGVYNKITSGKAVNRKATKQMYADLKEYYDNDGKGMGRQLFWENDSWVHIAINHSADGILPKACQKHDSAKTAKQICT